MQMTGQLNSTDQIYVFSIFHVLAMARSCLRKGGILIIETIAMNNPSYSMQYNFTGSEYICDWTDTGFISLLLLDYFCRFLKMEWELIASTFNPPLKSFLKPSGQGLFAGLSVR